MMLMMFTRKMSIKYIEDNKEEFLYSQDNCIDYLLEFSGIKYISLPRDVEKLDVLYSLKNLEGLCIYSSSYNRLDLSRIKSLQRLKIIFDSNMTNYLLDVKELKLVGALNSPRINDLKFGNGLKKLEISFWWTLSVLDNLPSSLSSLTLDYCLKLKDISYIKKLVNLSELKIFDCNKIEKLYEILSNLKSIKNLYLYNKETNVINHLKSIDFIDRMYSFECFISDYLIDDNNLNPLLKIKNKELLRWKKEYNIKRFND